MTEFSQLLTGVAGELYLHDVDSPGFYGQRGSYDTPFYNGGGNNSPNPDGLWPHDQKVCIESIGCYGRSEINYFAQGMWSAAAGESLATAKAIAFVWKEWEYREPPTEGVYFWIEYGFRYYEERANRWKHLQ